MDAIPQNQITTAPSTDEIEKDSKLVRIFILDHEGNWNDFATGNVNISVISSEEVGGEDQIKIDIVDASDDKELYTSMLSSHNNISRQQHTVITWNSSGNSEANIAISFESSVGCDNCWKRINNVLFIDSVLSFNDSNNTVTNINADDEDQLNIILGRKEMRGGNNNAFSLTSSLSSSSSSSSSSSEPSPPSPPLNSSIRHSQTSSSSFYSSQSPVLPEYNELRLENSIQQNISYLKLIYAYLHWALFHSSHLPQSPSFEVSFRFSQRYPIISSTFPLDTWTFDGYIPRIISLLSYYLKEEGCAVESTEEKEEEEIILCLKSIIAVIFYALPTPSIYSQLLQRETVPLLIRSFSDDGAVEINFTNIFDSTIPNLQYHHSQISTSPRSSLASPLSRDSLPEYNVDFMKLQDLIQDVLQLEHLRDLVLLKDGLLEEEGSSLITEHLRQIHFSIIQLLEAMPSFWTLISTLTEDRQRYLSLLLELFKLPQIMGPMTQSTFSRLWKSATGCSTSELQFISSLFDQVLPIAIAEGNSTSADLLSLLCSNDLNIVRDLIGKRDAPLLNAIINSIISPSYCDEVKSSLIHIVRSLLSVPASSMGQQQQQLPPLPSGSPPQLDSGESFLNFFYPNYAIKLLSPLSDASSFTDSFLLNHVEILDLFISSHKYRIKYLLFRSDIVQGTIGLISMKERSLWLRCAAVHVLISMMETRDEFYWRFIQKQLLFRSSIDFLMRVKDNFRGPDGGDNVFGGAVLSLFSWISKNLVGSQDSNDVLLLKHLNSEYSLCLTELSLSTCAPEIWKSILSSSGSLNTVVEPPNQPSICTSSTLPMDSEDLD